MSLGIEKDRLIFGDIVALSACYAQRVLSTKGWLQCDPSVRLVVRPAVKLVIVRLVLVRLVLTGLALMRLVLVMLVVVLVR